MRFVTSGSSCFLISSNAFQCMSKLVNVFQCILVGVMYLPAWEYYHVASAATAMRFLDFSRMTWGATATTLLFTTFPGGFQRDSKTESRLYFENSKRYSGLSIPSSLSAAIVISGNAIWVTVIQKTLEVMLLNVLAQMVDTVRRCERYRIVISSCNLDTRQQFLRMLYFLSYDEHPFGRVQYDSSFLWR